MAVVGAEPAFDLLGDVPARVVSDEKQDLLAALFELLSAPSGETESLWNSRADRPRT